MYLLLSLLFGFSSFQVKASTVTVFAASSLTDALSEIARNYELETKVKVRLSFDASSRLARQIGEEAKADLFFSASHEWNTYLEEMKKVIPGNTVNILTNELSLVTFKNSKIKLKSFKDLKTAKFKTLCLAQETVPAGKYAYEALRKMKLISSVKSRIVQGDNVRNVLGWVARDEADLGIVFVSDLKSQDKVKELLRIPSYYHSSIIYPLSLVGNTPSKDALSFYLYLQGTKARASFEKFGFKNLIL
jgi:molybdate transport system substrate-binding protein